MKGASSRDVPVWAVVSALALAVVLAVYVGANVLTGHTADPAPPKKVYPGMYDLRAEAAKARAANVTGVVAPSESANGR